MLKSILSVALLSAAIVAPGQAETLDAPTQIVRTADLNLASAAGRATLERRLTAAARAVCGDTDERDLALQSGAIACRNAARARAESKRTMLIAAALGDRSTVMASR